MRRYRNWSLLATLAFVAGLAAGGGAASAPSGSLAAHAAHAVHGGAAPATRLFDHGAPSTSELAQPVDDHGTAVILRTELDRLESILATSASASARLIPALVALLSALALGARRRPLRLAFAWVASPGLARARLGVGRRAPPHPLQALSS